MSSLLAGTSVLTAVASRVVFRQNSLVQQLSDFM